MAYTLIFCWKNLQKLLNYFQKNTCELATVLTRTVNILTTNELINLTMLWTTGPSMFWLRKKAPYLKLCIWNFNLTVQWDATKHILTRKQEAVIFLPAHPESYTHSFCFGTPILNLSESQDSQSYSGKFCNGRNDFLVGLTLYTQASPWTHRYKTVNKSLQEGSCNLRKHTFRCAPSKDSKYNEMSYQI